MHTHVQYCSIVCVCVCIYPSSFSLFSLGFVCSYIWNFPAGWPVVSQTIDPD